jgi:3-oxoacyl-[acyl-carrier protein] reductase
MGLVVYMDSTFRDLVVLVTGSTRGIGKAIAYEFVKRGAKVVLNYRKKDDIAKEVYEEFKKVSKDVLLVKADVSDEEAVNELFNKVEDIYGGVDILVNNAGLGLAYPLPEHSAELWDKILNINLRSAFLCSRYASKSMMEKRWGRIINVTSIAGIIGMMMLPSYSASKAGLIGLTKALALELAPYNITVNAVAAGLVKTKLGMSVFKLFTSDDKEADELAGRWAKKHTLIGRLLEPWEVARVVLFLADRASEGITGQVFVIDGGQTIVEGRFSL